MKSDLLFDFTPDKSTNTIHMTREFDAELALVWEAFTTPEILDQWGAPAPWVARTKSMDFQVGGRRHYAMVSPEGETHWSLQDYTVITPMTHLQFISGFSDADANINPELYGSVNDLHFTEENGITTVRTSIQYKSLEILEMMVKRGFKEGTSATFENLDAVLAKRKA